MLTIRRAPRLATRFIRLYSDNAAKEATTEAAKPPPILTAIRSDLKTALKAKDTNKLSIIRSILSEVMNASTAKPPRPLNTDIEVATLLLKLKARARESIEEAKASGRDDIVQKEQDQIATLEAYVGRVKMMSDEEIFSEVKAILERMTAEKGGATVKLPELMKEAKILLGDRAAKPSISNTITNMWKNL